MRTLLFKAPPLPYYIASGKITYSIGEAHPSRKNIGVFDMLIVTQGSLLIAEEDQQFVVSPHSVLILSPDKYHYSVHSCTEVTQFFWLHFQTRGTWTLNPQEQKCLQHDHFTTVEEFQKQRPSNSFVTTPFSIELPKWCSFKGYTKIETTLETLTQLEEQDTSFARWQQQIIFQSLLQDIHRQQPQGNRTSILLAENIAVFLRQNYRAPISYEALKEHFHFHPTYLARCMRHAFGCTPLEYLLTWRIEQSKHLLMHTNLTVKHIAEEVGFQHTSYFIRCFSQRVGFSPRIYREQFQR